MTGSLNDPLRPLRIAVIGAGPGGLAAAIALAQLPNVDLHVYEQARELREIGAGIGINQNTWRLLTLYGAAKNLEAFYVARDERVVDIEHRNGRTGELLAHRLQKEIPNGPPYARIERYKLQHALLKEVPAGLIQLRKKLVHLEYTPTGVSLQFDDGSIVHEVDLVVGADGIRSVVRKFAFPDHHITYTGKVAYRVLIDQEQVAHISGIPNASTFWHGPTTHVYTCPLPDGKFEIATRALESAEQGTKVSWGQDATTEQVTKHYHEYHPSVRAVLAAPASYQQYAMFGGPRLESVVAGGRIALIGDASHPLSGAFGSGAAFALEDAYTLKSAIEYARSRSQPLSFALELYDTTRSPHYKNLYGVLGKYAAVADDIKAANPPLSGDEIVSTTIQRNWDNGSTSWIYEYDITKVWKERVAKEDAKLRSVLPRHVHEPQSASLAPLSVTAVSA